VVARLTAHGPAALARLPAAQRGHLQHRLYTYTAHRHIKVRYKWLTAEHTSQDSSQLCVRSRYGSGGPSLTAHTKSKVSCAFSQSVGCSTALHGASFSTEATGAASACRRAMAGAHWHVHAHTLRGTGAGSVAFCGSLDSSGSCTQPNTGSYQRRVGL
jgi:hypothetical protein